MSELRGFPDPVDNRRKGVNLEHKRLTNWRKQALKFKDNMGERVRRRKEK